MTLPDKTGHFGEFGGRFVPETLMAVLEKLETVFNSLKNDKNFKVTRALDVTHYVPNVYIKQAEDILRDKIYSAYLDYLVIPVGTGKTFVAFYRALKNLNAAGRTIKTKLVGVVPKGENPIYHKFVYSGSRIRGYNPTSLADKLSCPHTTLLRELKRAKRYGHSFVEMDNDDIRFAIREYEKNRIASFHGGAIVPMLEPSGLVGYCIINPKIASKAGIENAERIGIFITGFGVYRSYFPNSVIFSVDN